MLCKCPRATGAQSIEIRKGIRTYECRKNGITPVFLSTHKHGLLDRSSAMYQLPCHRGASKETRVLIAYARVSSLSSFLGGRGCCCCILFFRMYKNDFTFVNKSYLLLTNFDPSALLVSSLMQ